MPASINDKLTNTASTTTARPQPTQVTSTRSAGVFTLSCNALTGWPTDTKVHFATYKLNTAGAKIVGSQIDMDGIVSGTSIGSITIRGGTDVGNAIGDIVEMAPTAAWAYDLNKWGTVHADASGNLLTAAVQAALGLTSLNGYTPLGATPNTVTYNGNRSYDLVFNTTDLTGVLSNGMRLRTTRTVVAPTQCTSLNGTTQYYSKSSPAGMTFTDDFVAGAWVKLSSYSGSTMGVISRFDGTSGWSLEILTDGRFRLVGWNSSSANFSFVQSYQSVPLNKWVHITAQLDMSTFTASTTTSYLMLDGVDVPASVARGGTNPTALVQAGTLNVGAENASLFFPGKIAQAFVTNAKVTQATIRSNYYSQSISPTEISLISAYSFNNTINDLNTTNANNLTANGSAVATNADSPFALDDEGIPLGTNDCAVVTKVAFSTNTTVTVQVPEGCTIPTIGGVSAVVYSSNKVPYGYRDWDREVQHVIMGAAQTGITAEADWLGMTITTAAPAAGTRYRFTVRGYQAQTSANTQNIMRVKDGSTELRQHLFATPNTTNAFGIPQLQFEVVAGTAGAHSYKVTMNAPGGGTLQAYALTSSNQISEFILEQLDV